MTYPWKRQDFVLALVTMITLSTIFFLSSGSHTGGTTHFSTLTPENMANLSTASSYQNEPHEGLYGGGTGETIEDAVIINVTSSLVGIPAEYHYVSNKCGRRNVDWTLKLQEHMGKDGRELPLNRCHNSLRTVSGVLLQRSSTHLVGGDD